MVTRYFIVFFKKELFGLFQSNHEGATSFQISQLLKEPNMVVQEVDEGKYTHYQAEAKKKFG